MSSENKVQFFWEKNARQKGRFNLLLLEYGEHLHEDLSVYYFPIPNINTGRTTRQSDSLKVQGRLKLCSRSFIFEPTETRKPIIRYPFKYISSLVESYFIQRTELSQCLAESSGLMSFICTSTIEMKPNDKVGPFKQIDGVEDEGRVAFALVHSDLTVVMSKMNALLQVYTVAAKQGKAAADRLSSPYTKKSSVNTFDNSLLVDFHERILTHVPIPVKKVQPLVLNPGSLVITNSRVYYQPDQTNNVDDVSVKSMDLASVRQVYKRRYLLRAVGLELIMSGGTSTFFCFELPVDRDHVYSLICSHPHLVGGNTPPIGHITQQWQNREISNFEYLMYLNSEADRSVNDITQYPVFPHIIADYTSKSLNLSKSATFRDLSKPVGALHSGRLEHFRARFSSMEPEDPSNGIPPPFMYGTHYSTPGYVLHYLVRVAPEHMLCLQNGKFDAADRMFVSMADSFESVTSNPADLKELIPEFFCGSGEFLVNSLDLDLGHRQTGERVGDVELPPWAKSRRDFIRKNIKALECDYVSDHIHHWIDLIFGYQQKGEEAVAADNVFYHLTYEGAVDLEKVTNPDERAALEIQIQEFGQTPKQLFSSAHPSRGGGAGDCVAATISKGNKEKVVEGASSAAAVLTSASPADVQHGEGNSAASCQDCGMKNAEEKVSPLISTPSNTISNKDATTGKPSKETTNTSSGHQELPKVAVTNDRTTSCAGGLTKPVPEEGSAQRMRAGKFGFYSEKDSNEEGFVRLGNDFKAALPQRSGMVGGGVSRDADNTGQGKLSPASDTPKATVFGSILSYFTPPPKHP